MASAVTIIGQANGNKYLSSSGTVNNSPVDPDLTIRLASVNSSVEVKDEFWDRSEEVQLSRWNKLFPYQLLVVRAVKSGDQVSHEPVQGWVFTLPLPPESYSISMPFAITTSATMGGIIEEHNGAPFRTISLRGTMGMLPGRGAAAQQNGFNWKDTIAGGTLSQFRRVEGDVTAVLSAVSGQSPNNPNVHKSSDFDDRLISDSGANGLAAKTTGYYQLHQLSRFLERYSAIKKTKGGRDLRLALAVWKDDSVFLCTPMSFETSKSAGSPLEYQYSLQLKAWRRINLGTSEFGTYAETPIRRNPNALARVMNTLEAARRVIQQTSRLPDAIVGDIKRLIDEPIREAVLFCKDALGLSITLADMPSNIRTAASQSWVNAQNEIQGLLISASTTGKALKDKWNQGILAANETADSQDPSASLSSHPASAPFRSNVYDGVNRNYQFFSGIGIADLKLPPQLQQKVEEEKKRVVAKTRTDFENNRNAARAVADKAAAALGAGHPSYDDTYKGTEGTPQSSGGNSGGRAGGGGGGRGDGGGKAGGGRGDGGGKAGGLSPSNAKALFALNDVVISLDKLAATADNEPSSREGKMQTMAGLSRRSGMAFQVPTSKFAVPFPYGATLESLATKYLGDPQRWREIAVLNGLVAPYVDEVGFDVKLITNGSGSQVNIPTTNLFVGQQVYISSKATRRTRRQITGLRQVGTGLVVTVDGPSDMSAYTTADGAILSAFLPDTVNSQSLIYIPSQDEPADDNFITKSIPGINEFDPMVAVGGVDLLLDSNNDIIITPDGDTRLAAGLANIIQIVRTALSVRRGSLLKHPSFGLPVKVGDSTADVSAQEISSSVKAMLSQDPMFSRIDAVKVEKSGGTAAINIAVTVNGSEQPVPISYKVRGDFQTAE